jgi:serine/threonine protein kinase
MEKAPLRDLSKINNYFYHKNLLKVIYDPFDEVLGENLLRFYSKQIINALELLDRNYYVHNDIKPQNILITHQLIVKLTDFSLLTKVKDKETEIPGGTPGYLSPEYYINKKVDSEVARKQDYFALGSTLYFLKYGESMLKYNDNNEKFMIADEIIKLLEQKRDKIKSGKMSDGEFINFLCSLIEYKPDDRPCFEEIYRNIWLNKNSEQINNIHSINQGEEEKMIMELQKSDFLIKKEKENEQDLNLENEQKIKENKNIKKDENKKKKINKLYRFRFKKRIKN